MKKLDTYQIVALIGLIIVGLFYLYDYYYLHLQPLTRYCIGMSFLMIFVLSFVFLKAKWGESSRVRVAQNFGKVISEDDVHLCFERNNNSFIWEADFGGHKISFYLPKTSELFAIRQQDWKPFSAGKSLLEHIMTNQTTDDSAEKMFAELRVIQVPNVSGKFVLQSRNAEFLQQLLSNENVKNNLNKYNESKIKITFNGSLFEMKWQTGSNEELEDFTQICQTGIIFNQEIVRLLGKS
jgi:hypothetical protein